eukprot:UN32859
MYDLLLKNGTYEGQSFALNKMGEAYLSGTVPGSNETDIYQAEVLFRKASDLGSAEAQFNLGYLLENFMDRKEEAWTHFECARVRGSEHASLLHGFRMLNGLPPFDKTSCSDSVKIYQKLSQKTINTRSSLDKKLAQARLSRESDRDRAVNFPEEELQYAKEQATLAQREGAQLAMGQSYLFG